MEQFSEKSVAEESARQWLARFAPYVYALTVENADDCRAQIERLRGLAVEAGPLVRALETDPTADPALLGTLRQAISTLGGIEDDLRRKLAKLAPGDPAALVDLDDLRERLAERAAREELGETSGVEVPTRWNQRLSPASPAAAVGLFVFGTGWNAFTAVHATFMIGGMASQFGWPAYIMLLFYAIFFGAGFSMWAGAVESGSRQEVEMDGNRLTLVKTLGPWVRRKTWDLDPKEPVVSLDPMEALQSGGMTFTGPGKRLGGAVVAIDVSGNEVRLGTGLDAARRDLLAKRINDHLDGLA